MRPIECEQKGCGPLLGQGRLVSSPLSTWAPLRVESEAKAWRQIYLGSDSREQEWRRQGRVWQGRRESQCKNVSQSWPLLQVTGAQSHSIFWWGDARGEIPTGTRPPLVKLLTLPHHWLVLSVMSKKLQNGKWEAWAVVRPCQVTLCKLAKPAHLWASEEWLGRAERICFPRGARDISLPAGWDAGDGAPS